MKVGYAAVFQNQELLKRLPNESSIYSAKVIAIDLAMNIITNHKSSKFIIYSDSKSVLQALQSKDSSSPLITRLLDKMNTLSKNNSIFTWIPSHIGIQGNERAAWAAKKALQTHISNIKIPYTDLKPLINKFILKKWQKSWDDQTQNKLHHIQDTIGEWPAGYRRNRKEEVIIFRLRIGHTHITHSHLLKGEDSPVCSTCKVPPTVKHILINCDSFCQICPKHYQTNNLKNFKNSKPEEILSFLKEINLFIKI